MDRQMHILSAAYNIFKRGDSPLDSDGSTRSSLSSIHQQFLQSYKNGVYSVEEKWDQDSNDTSDNDTKTLTPLFIYGGSIPGSVFLSASSPTFLQFEDEDPSFSLQQTEALEVQPGQRKHLRPCKGKRERFRKVIDHLKEKVRQELGSFDVDHIPLPKCMANDPKTVDRVKSMMVHYRDQVLAGVEVPDLDAKLFKMRAKHPTLQQPSEMEMSF